MALSYSLSTPKLGSVSASSLVKSAATLSNELNTYNDTIQKLNFENNPTDTNFQSYTQYLQGRISTLQGAGTITDLTKAANLTQEINTAYKTNTTFNVDTISTQMLAGNATDQTKLDYLSNTVLANPIVQGDPSMYAKYMEQAYNLQQSIQYQAQAQATANEVAYNANEAATKQGYTNSIDALTSSWKTITDTFKDGGANEVQKALQDFTSSQADTFKALGVNMPKGAQLTMAGVAQAVLQAQGAYYENGAVALGTNTADGQSFMQKAQDIATGVTTLATPAGTMNIFEVNKWASAPTNLYRTNTNENGQTTLTENSISGYTVKNGQVIPQVNTNNGAGSNLSTFEQLPKTTQTGLKTRLGNLGFNVVGTSSGNVTVQLTNKTAKWMGMKNTDLMPGDQVTLISTNGGKGFQMESNSGKVYGISFDQRGLAGLYGENSGGGWDMVQGQYGFDPTTVSRAQVPSATTGALSDMGHFLVSTVPQHVAAAFSSPVKKPSMSQRAGGGYNFTNSNGQSISAATYSQLTGMSFRTLLQNMANSGDAGAKQVLGFVGNNYQYDPTKISAGTNAQMYNDMTWGAEPNARVASGGVTLPSGVKL